jgi:hypothetical protein
MISKFRESVKYSYHAPLLTELVAKTAKEASKKKLKDESNLKSIMRAI